MKLDTWIDGLFNKSDTRRVTRNSQNVAKRMPWPSKTQITKWMKPMKLQYTIRLAADVHNGVTIINHTSYLKNSTISLLELTELCDY